MQSALLIAFHADGGAFIREVEAAVIAVGVALEDDVQALFVEDDHSVAHCPRIFRQQVLAGGGPLVDAQGGLPGLKVQFVNVENESVIAGLDDAVFAVGEWRVAVVAAAVGDLARGVGQYSDRGTVLRQGGGVVGPEAVREGGSARHQAHEDFRAGPRLVEMVGVGGEHIEGVDAVGRYPQRVAFREGVLDIEGDGLQGVGIRHDVPEVVHSRAAVVGLGAPVGERACQGGHRFDASGGLRGGVGVLRRVGIAVHNQLLRQVEMGAHQVELVGVEVVVVGAVPAEVEVVVVGAVHHLVAVAEEAVPVDVGVAPAGIVHRDAALEVRNDDAVPVELGGVAEEVFGGGVVFEEGAQYAGGAVIVHSGAVGTVHHIHAHAAVVHQRADVGVDGGGFVAHRLVVVVGGAVVGRLHPVVLVGVGVGADARFREAEVVDELCHCGGHAAGHHVVVLAGEVFGAVVVVELALSPVRAHEGLHEVLLVAERPAATGQTGPGGMFGLQACGLRLQLGELRAVVVEPHLHGRDHLTGTERLTVGEGQHGGHAPVSSDDGVAVLSIEDIIERVVAADGHIDAMRQPLLLRSEEVFRRALCVLKRDVLCENASKKENRSDKKYCFPHKCTVEKRLQR